MLQKNWLRIPSKLKAESSKKNKIPLLSALILPFSNNKVSYY
jgi:hypothetical protein